MNPPLLRRNANERGRGGRWQERWLEDKMRKGEIMLRWVAYVAHGRGQRRSWAEGKYSYIEEVLYSYHWPVSRLIVSKKRPLTVVCLMRSQGGISPQNQDGIIFERLN